VPVDGDGKIQRHRPSKHYSTAKEEDLLRLPRDQGGRAMMTSSVAYRQRFCSCIKERTQKIVNSEPSRKHVWYKSAVGNFLLLA